MFGVRDEETSTPKTGHITVWEGDWFGSFTAEAKPRHGVKSATFTDYNGDKVRVILPDGVTFPRTGDNFRAIDAAISAAFDAHYAAKGRFAIYERNTP